MAAETHSPIPAAEALLHRVLDGQASAVELARFEQELAASESLRATYQALSGLVQVLDSFPAPEPPGGMKEAVLARLGSRRPPRRLNTRMLFLGIACASAAALLLVVGLRQPGPSPSLSTGTMAPREAAGWPLLSRTTAPTGALTVRCKDRDYAFFLEGTGSASLRWNPDHWVGLSTSGNPILLRRLASSTEVGLRVDGVEVLTLPIAGQP